MKRMTQWTLLVQLAGLPLVSADEVRNPFQSQNNPAQAVQEGGVVEVVELYRPPLERDPLQSYTLLGVLVAEHRQLAVVQNRIGDQLVLNRDQSLGREAAVVQQITAQGVTLASKGQRFLMQLGTSAVALEGEQQ